MIHTMFINGKWIASASGEIFESLNPATGGVLTKVYKGSAADAKLAIKAAENAFPLWRDTPAPERAKILFRTAELLRNDKARLAKLVTDEMGKVRSEAEGDVQEAIDVFEYMAGEGRRLYGYTTTSELRDKFSMTIRVPVGVVGLITPWNFPIAIPAWKIAPALICGNTIVFKPSSDTPLCAIELVKIIEKAGLPKGVLNLVMGPGSGTGEEIVKNSCIHGLSFTGSKETGEWIQKNAGIKKIGLELGGKNPIIIMDDADLHLAVDGVVWGAFGTTGQRCTAASRVIVHRKIKKKFEEMLAKKARKLKLGYGWGRADVGPLINKDALEKTEKYVAIGKQEGARLLCGGRCKGRKGFFFLPTIFTDVRPDSRLAQEEIFGPVLSIIECSDIESAIKIANSTDYGLSSAIYTKDMRNAFLAVNRIQAGITYVNSSTIGSEVHLPFGGMKGSGNTREAGISGIEEFSETKTVYFDYSGRLQKAQIDV